tara:strand:+ start:251 stop:508 length:258 start_codon:yes stop_codon:yes gene_type:complete
MTEKRWRSKSPRAVYARRISKHHFWRLKKAMREDGLIATVGDRGIEWEIGGYTLTNKSVANAWDMTTQQLRRFCDWVYENPWDET